MLIIILIGLYIASLAMFWLGYAINYVALKAHKQVLDVEQVVTGYIDSEYVDISDKLETEKANAFMYAIITLVPVINTIVAFGKLRNAICRIKNSLAYCRRLKLG